MINEQELNKYYKDVSKALKCRKERKHEFIAELKANTEELVSSGRDVTISDIYKEFGTPGEIAESFSEAEGGKTGLRRSVLKLLLAFVILALVIYIAFVIASYIDVHEEAHGYMQESLSACISAFWRCFA